MPKAALKDVQTPFVYSVEYAVGREPPNASIRNLSGREQIDGARDANDEFRTRSRQKS